MAKEGLWTSPMSRSEKVCSASAVSAVVFTFFQCESFFTMAFFRRAWQASF